MVKRVLLIAFALIGISATGYAAVHQGGNFSGSGINSEPVGGGGSSLWDELVFDTDDWG